MKSKGANLFPGRGARCVGKPLQSFLSSAADNISQERISLSHKLAKSWARRTIAFLQADVRVVFICSADIVPEQLQSQISTSPISVKLTTSLIHRNTQCLGSHSHNETDGLMFSTDPNGFNSRSALRSPWWRYSQGDWRLHVHKHSSAIRWTPRKATTFTVDHRTHWRTTTTTLGLIKWRSWNYGHTLIPISRKEGLKMLKWSRVGLRKVDCWSSMYCDIPKEDSQKFLGCRLTHPANDYRWRRIISTKSITADACAGLSLWRTLATSILEVQVSNCLRHLDYLLRAHCCTAWPCSTHDHYLLSSLSTFMVQYTWSCADFGGGEEPLRSVPSGTAEARENI